MAPEPSLGSGVIFEKKMDLLFASLSILPGDLEKKKRKNSGSAVA